MPLCIDGGVTIGQGAAVARYIAYSHGLMGSSPVEVGMIENIYAHVEVRLVLDSTLMRVKNDAH